MRKSATIAIAITLFFALVTGLLWLGLHQFSGAFVQDRLQKAAAKSGLKLKVDSARLEPAGLLVLEKPFLIEEASETTLASLDSVHCTFSPLKVFFGEKLTPKCMLNGMRSNVPITEVTKLMKRRFGELSAPQPPQTQSSGLWKYLSAPRQWTIVADWHVEFDHFEGKGNLVFEPGESPYSDLLSVFGDLSTPFISESRPFIIRGELDGLRSVKSALISFPKRLLFKGLGGSDDVLSLRRVEVGPTHLELSDTRGIFSGTELYAKTVRIEDGSSLVGAVKRTILSGKLPPSSIVKGFVTKGKPGTLQAEEARVLTTNVGSSIRMKNLEFLPTKEHFLLQIPSLSLTAVKRDQWRTELPKSELLITSPQLFWREPETSGHESSQSLEGRILALIKGLLQKTTGAQSATASPPEDAPLVAVDWVKSLPQIRLVEGSVVMGSPAMAKNQKDIAVIGGISATWETKENEGSFVCSATMSPDEQMAAATISGTYDLQKSRIKNVKFRTSNTLFPRLLATASNKLVMERDASIAVTLDMDLSHPSLWHLKGDVEAQGMGFNWWRIAPMPVEDLSFKTSIDASFDRLDRRLSVHFPDMEVEKAEVAIKMVVENLGASPFFKLDMKLPRQPCSYAFGAIPDAMIPRLSALRVAGDMEMGLSMKLNSADPYSLKLDIEGDLESCTVLRLGEALSMSRLRNPTYVHRPYVEGEELAVEVGPGSPSWTPYYRIPSYVSMAAVATEDLDFFVHQGFKVSLIRRAMKLNLDKERYVYGGSTISQQLVKNLFLSREKNLSRKLEEAILTWQMEREVDKIRILELYLNCIEYGPGIYGIANGAAHYFDKPVESLTPLEGAFLMGLKPCPSCGFRQWRRKGVNKRWQSKLEFIMNRLFKRGWITEEQFLAEAPYRPIFAYAEDIDDIAP